MGNGLARESFGISLVHSGMEADGMEWRSLVRWIAALGAASPSKWSIVIEISGLAFHHANEYLFSLRG